MSRKHPLYSIVVLQLNEEENIPKLYEEVRRVFTSINSSWETIFVDDGSTDNSWDTNRVLNKTDSNIKGIRLSRNYGHQLNQLH